MTVFLKNMSWVNFQKKKENTNLVIIPTGAFEVYGQHLPLGSDILVAVKISEMVAEKLGAIVGPSMEVGDSSMLDDFPGTITIRPESFKNYLLDILVSLKKWGFKDFLFVNNHLGNVPIIDQLSRDLQRDDSIRCAQIDYWRFVQTVDKGIVETEIPHGHASEAGTSVLQYLYPECVDMDLIVDEHPSISNNFPDIIQYVKYGDLSKSGTIGDATAGTPEKGKQLVDRSVNRIVEFLVESWGYSAKD
ncbi:creatininase family protein [Neobacillus niacini]|uniref:creatininase family protein n=1 Tax=Neobacillus niacini TaxID=86668 RepID=UPI00204218F0|nr:creatininase family protein [Neobacillus niacini]MCM3691934.1 creatininase family protein [Neobacillus niacini]